TMHSIQAALNSKTLASDGTSNTLMVGFASALARELHLGANGENWQSLPGISSVPAVQSGPAMFSYSGLSTLTSQLVTDRGIIAILIGLLTQAQTAEAKGDINGETTALSAFEKQVNSGMRNGQIQVDAAQVLIALSRSM